MTIYIGNIPAGYNNAVYSLKLKSILMLFGSVSKWNHPVDASGAYKTFGFVTFERGISAWKCYKILCCINLSDGSYSEDINSDTNATGETTSEANPSATSGMYVTMKAGSKEKLLLASISELIDEKYASDLNSIPRDAVAEQDVLLLGRILDSIVDLENGRARDVSACRAKAVDTPTSTATPTAATTTTITALDPIANDSVHVTAHVRDPASVSVPSSTGPSEAEPESSGENVVLSEIEKYRQRITRRDK